MSANGAASPPRKLAWCGDFPALRRCGAAAPRRSKRAWSALESRARDGCAAVNESTPSDVTTLLDALAGGRREAFDEVLRVVYDELRSLAAGYLRRERPEHTLATTALVHDAYLRLVRHDARWESRAHFFRVAACAMRRILVDHARRRRAAKRGGAAHRVPLTEGARASDVSDSDFDLEALDQALEKLARVDERKCRIVELRYLAGVSAEETARVLDTSLRTVEREWRFARAWLRSDLLGESADG